MTDKKYHPTQFRDARGAPSTNVTKLAQTYSVAALKRLAELTDSGNDCVALGAVRMMMELGHGRVPAGTPAHLKKRRKGKNLKVTIRSFKEGSDAGDVRHHELPMVYGGWQGPRDLGVPGDQRLSALRGQRAGVCEQPGVGDGAAPGLQGTGASAWRDCGMSAAAAKRGAIKTRKRRAAEEE